MNRTDLTAVFQVMEPEWTLTGVTCCTVLARDVQGTPVSFDRHEGAGVDSRRRLEAMVPGSFPMHWLRQIHGTRVLRYPEEIIEEADGCFTDETDVVCAVLTADCLPVALASKDGSVVGVAHAGRKGLECSILCALIKRMGVPPEDLLGWIGPCIAPESYQVQETTRSEYLKLHPGGERFFREDGPGHWKMDLPAIAKEQLIRAGLSGENVSWCERDTFADPMLHSARRDGTHSGRMVTLIWKNAL